jgi:hypothetical protein
LAGFVLDHVGDYCLEVVEGSVYVYVEKSEVVFEGVVKELAAHGNSCVLHNHIDDLSF